jgi:hypothetical protein
VTVTARARPAGRAGQAEEFLGEPVEVEGLLDLRTSYGFLRLKGCLPSKEDVYVR